LAITCILSIPPRNHAGTAKAPESEHRTGASLDRSMMLFRYLFRRILMGVSPRRYGFERSQIGSALSIVTVSWALFWLIDLSK
jgi:hypothetical protein